MFDIEVGHHRDCDGVSRREFLRVGGLSALGLALPQLLQADAAKPGRSEVSCILLWMGGGPSHIDTFDPKPDAPSEIRGEFGAISTNVSGIQISDKLPKLAKQADKYSILRSVTSPDANHETATHYLLTGYAFNPAIEYPAYGSVVMREKGPRAGMPANVLMGGYPFAHGGAGYMGAVYNPFNINGDPANPAFSVQDVSPPNGVDMERVARRRSILEQLDNFQRDVETRGRVVQAKDAFTEQAYSLITSPVAKKAFDLKQEPEKVREMYGKHYFGQSCLLARRLVEAGVRFVTINFGGWDTHENNFGSLKNHLLPRVDDGYAALLQDLKDRGMLDTTLVVWMGEFGRTPKVNSSAGRDHWSQSMVVTMGGGGIKTGMVVGSTNERAEMPKERPIRVEDVAATVYHALGVDTDKEYMSPQNRPIKVNYDGEPVKELFKASV
jgi:hypothetical protein